MASTNQTISATSAPNLEQRIHSLEQQMERRSHSNALSLVVFNGELDKLMAAFVIATGAASCGMQVSMFFTFWATAALKKHGPQVTGKRLVERMFGWLLPGGFHKRKLSQLDMFGLGRRMMAREMRNKNVATLPELIDLAKELEIEINICEMSMSLMGIHKDELIDFPDLGFCGVARFIEQSSKANTTLFI